MESKGDSFSQSWYLSQSVLEFLLVETKQEHKDVRVEKELWGHLEVVLQKAYGFHSIFVMYF